MPGGEKLETRVAVIEAIIKERDSALLLAKQFSDAHFEALNHARQRDGELPATFLRSDVYDKSEGLHRAERETLNDRVKALEIRITQVATVGAIAVLAATMARPIP